MISLDKRQLFLYALAAITLGLLSFLFPNTLRFKYEYEEGKVWRYADLVAPYDFGIVKPISELNEEYAAIDSLFRNHYLKDPSLIDTIIKNFDADYHKTIQGLDPSKYRTLINQSEVYANLGKSILRKYYSAGIYQIDSLADRRDATEMTLIENNEVKTTRPLSVSDVNELVKKELAGTALEFSGLLYPLITRHVYPNISYDREKSERLKHLEKEKIAVTRGKVAQGELIISKDAIITKEIVQKLDSYRLAHIHKVSNNKSQWLVWIGYLLLSSLLLGIFVYFLQERLGPGLVTSIKNLFFILLWIVVFAYVTYLVESNGTLSLYIIPYCIAPIVLKTFFNTETAFFTYLVMILTIALIMSLGFEFILLELLSGFVVIATNRVTRYWSPFFRSILLIGLTYGLGYLGLTIIKEGNLAGFLWKNYLWFVVNVILVMLAYPLVPLLERIFGFTSAITLAELGDVNNPLLKELSLKAPGTFQHSLQVANIAEAAADTIKADSLLLRVSALYHDIGKMNEPEIFIENQGSHDPHALLSAEESAKKIISHVTIGVAMGRKNRLPKAVVDMISTHHGTTRVEYFYKRAKSEDPSLNDMGFRYPGPKPRTREEAILMLADSIEAACKSLKNPTEKDVNEMVDTIIAGKEGSNQLSESDLSYYEMNLIKNSFKKILKGIYHVRIEYPKDEVRLV
jgi:putative nucleotidyltransferase with HDIG domain